MKKFLIGLFILVNTSISHAQDPATAMAVAQFGLSVYSMSQGGSDPMIQIAQMLAAINKKLNEINKKLDYLVTEVHKLPKKDDYVRNYNDIVSIHGQLETSLNKYERYKKHGRRAKSKFLASEKQNLLDHLQSLRLKRRNLFEYSDPNTVSLLCTSTHIDYEISTLIGEDSESLHSEMEAYGKYLHDAMWEGDKCLDSQLADYAQSHKSILSRRYKNLEFLVLTYHDYAIGNFVALKREDSLMDNLTNTLESRGFDIVENNYVRLQWGKVDYKTYKYAKVVGTYKENAKNIARVTTLLEKNTNEELKMNHLRQVTASIAYISALETLKFITTILE